MFKKEEYGKECLIPASTRDETLHLFLHLTLSNPFLKELLKLNKDFLQLQERYSYLKELSLEDFPKESLRWYEVESVYGYSESSLGTLTKDVPLLEVASCRHTEICLNPLGLYFQATSSRTTGWIYSDCLPWAVVEKMYENTLPSSIRFIKGE